MKDKLARLILSAGIAAFALTGCQSSVVKESTMTVAGNSRPVIEIGKGIIVVPPEKTPMKLYCCDSQLDNCVRKSGDCPWSKPLVKIE